MSVVKSEAIKYMEYCHVSADYAVRFVAKQYVACGNKMSESEIQKTIEEVTGEPVKKEGIGVSQGGFRRRVAPSRRTRTGRRAS